VIASNNSRAPGRAPWRAFLVVLLALAIPALSQAPTGPAVAEAASRIVYANDGRLLYITPSGAPLGRTGRSGYGVVDIATSDDGRRTAVLQRTGTDGAHGDFFRLYVRTAGERRLQEVAINGPILEAAAPSVALSPDGRTLAISIAREIRLVDLATKRRRTLREVERGYDTQPSFTADGRHLVFCHGKPYPYRSDIYEIALGSGTAHRLAGTGRQEFFPQLSPDRRHLAFLRRERGGFVLIVARANGSGERVVRHVDELVSRPDFSPDGRRVAFATVRGLEYATHPRWALFTSRLDGSETRAVLRSNLGGPLLPQWARMP